MIKDIDVLIRELISSLGEEFKVLKYVYNSNREFIPGATPVYYSGPYWGKEEVVEAIKSLLIGDWLSSGEKVKTFENVFAHRINQKYAVMVNSGSSANLVMIAALKKYYDWKDQDEIIISVVGFPTTLAPIIQNNLKPIFVDIEMDSLNFNLNLIEEKITSKTKAVIASPVLGNPFDFDKLLKICSDNNILFILDNCDSLGSKWNGKYLNEYTTISTNSFYPSHHITSLPYDEQILLQSPKKEIQLKSIGDFVENIDYRGWKCVAFDKNSNLMWKEITGIVKHDFREKYLYKITTQTGRTCTVTGNHSLFKFKDLNNSIENINAENLKVDDYILVPNKIPSIENDVMIDFLTYSSGNWKFINKKIMLDEEIAYFLGYCVAESSYHKSKKSGNYTITLSLHENETKTAQYLIKLIQTKFNINSGKIYKIKNTKGISLKFSNKGMYEFLIDNIGRGAANKKIPDFIFSAKNKIKWSFINGYFSGDGHHHVIDSSLSNSYDCKTVSKTLASQLYYLLLMLGVSARFSKEKGKNGVIFNNKKTSYCKDSYSLCYNKSLKSIVNSHGFRNSKKHNFNRTNNDLTMLKITKIEKIEYTKKYVYDISVNGYENFVAGIGFSVHNTGEGGMVVSNDRDLIKTVRSFSWWGRDCTCVGANNLIQNGSCAKRFDKWLDGYDGIIDHKYVFTNIGYNLKPLDLQGAIGLVQMNKFDEIHAKRKISKNTIGNLLEKYVTEVRIPKEIEYAETSWFGTPIICNSKNLKDMLVNYLETKKIQTRNYFAGNILLHQGYKHLDDFLKYPEANKVLERVLFIGASPHYTQEIFDYIEHCLQKFDYE